MRTIVDELEQAALIESTGSRLPQCLDSSTTRDAAEPDDAPQEGAEALGPSFDDARGVQDSDAAASTG